MKGNVHGFPFLVPRSVDVTEVLNSIICIDIDVLLERLAKCLYLLCSTPYAVLP